MRRLLATSCVLIACAACGSGDEAASPEASNPRTTTTTAPPPATTSSLPSPPPTSGARPDLESVSVKLTEVTGGLDSPVALAQMGEDPVFLVAEQGGTVRAIVDGIVEPEPLLDISDEVSSGGEQGLLGIARSPDGGHLYVDYTDAKGDTHVDEYTIVGDLRPTLTSRRPVLFVDQPFANHNGGEVTFGPDGMLYVGLGDGGSGGDPIGNGQNLGVLLGKILRIDPRPSGGAAYTVPDDNPFVGHPGAAPEVWQYGLRNPWRFSFDRETGDVWIGDVGQNEWEEVDFAPAAQSTGVNWGWDLREGTHEFEGDRPPGGREPIHEYPNPDQGRAVTGGYVYRGSAIPALRGAYVFADAYAGDLIAIVEEQGRAADVRPLGVNGGSVSSFAEDAAGEIYVLDLAGGRLLRVDPA